MPRFGCRRRTCDRAPEREQYSWRDKDEIDKKLRTSNIETANLTIPAAEEIIEEALNELAYSQDPGLVRALRFLAPPGYQAIVELCSENGRSKRRNASADTWSPEEDEVRIYFERIDGCRASARSNAGSCAAAPVQSHA